MTKEMESRSSENGLDRYRVLEERIRQTQFPITEKSILEINSEVYVYEENSDALFAPWNIANRPRCRQIRNYTG